MKTILLTLKTAILITVSCIITTGCVTSEYKHVEAKASFPEHEHGAVDHAGGHMDHMNEVQQRLKYELGEQYNQLVPTATKEQLALGGKIFMQSCAACHGEGGKGDGSAAAAFKQPPADFTDSEHSTYYSDQGRIQVIKKGIKDTPMSGWENILNEKEIQSVYVYIRALRSPSNGSKHGHSDHHH